MPHFRLAVAVALTLSASALSAQSGGGRYIVEFVAPAAAFAPQSRATAGHEETFTRFRDDLGRIEPAAPDATDAASVGFEYDRAFHGASVRLTRRDSIAAIRALPYVRGIWPDGEMTAFDEVGGDARGTATRSASLTGGAGVVVAVIDSGIDAAHPAFAGRILGGHDFVNDDGDPDDDYSHGTHVAGIVAGNGGGVTGVAPAASLLVYKVLDENGKGRASAIIAAIERAIDPNLDGDFSDRADVINLSLGGPGSPDDPISRAVDGATAAGAVVVAAAGNSGLYHSVGSPAAARTAIAVGAHDSAFALAEFSARGPATSTGAIKPDVLAPGVSIRSAAPGGGTRVSSGTSMAAPYVAGVAAMLRESHPDWDPARVRSAIVNSALPLDAEEVMSQGAGRVDPGRALAAELFALPSALDFGLDATTGATFVAQRELVITNGSDEPRSFALHVAGVSSAVTIELSPTELALAPGASGSVRATLTADNALLGDPPSASFAFGGVIEISSAGRLSRVPWAFLRAGRATIRYGLEFPSVYWTADEPRAASFAIVDTNTVETLLAPGTYDLTLLSSWEGDLRVITREGVAVEGDTQLELSPDDAGHAVTLAAVDAMGRALPLADDGTRLWFPQIRLLFPAGSPIRSVELPRSAGKALHVSMESPRWGLLASESYLDGASSQFVVVQHPALRGIDGDRVLSGGGDALRAKQLQLRFPGDATRREIGILARGVTRRPDEAGRAPLGIYIASQPAQWDGTLWMTPETHGDYASALQVFAYTQHPETQGLAANVTSPVRLRGERFFSARSFDPPPLPVDAPGDEAIRAGDGVAFPVAILGASSGFLTGDLEIQGDRNDTRRLSRGGALYTVRRNGVETARGRLGVAQPFIPLAGGTAHDVTIDAATSIGGATGRTTLLLSLDTAREDAAPPSLTSLAILDARSRHTNRLPLAGRGRLVLSAGDYDLAYEGPQYKPGALTIRSAFFRRSGALAWTQLPLRQTAEDTAAGETRTPAGLVLEAELADALLREGGIDLRIELVDAVGNSAVTTIEPAFVVDRARIRGARRD